MAFENRYRKYHTDNYASVTGSKNFPQHKLVTIASEEHGRLQIKQDALKQILCNPAIGDKPISIISIAGQYRTGKSFLLNFFMRYLQNNGWRNSNWIGNRNTKVTDGVDWSRGTEAHTKGILMCPEVFIVKDGREEIAVLLMDTQGLFDTDTGSDTNARILSVSTLLSSHQILNIMNRIEERDLEHLQLCSNHAKAATRSGRRAEDLDKPFEALTFLVRDWQYEFEHRFGEGGMDYLDGILKQSSTCTELNNIKKAIRNVFKDVRCFLMPHPGDDVLMKNRTSVTNQDLDEDFYDFVKEFVAKVLHPKNLVTKKFDGKVLTANEIMDLMSSVADCFRRGKIPEIRSLYEEAAYSLNQKVMEKSVEKYKVEMEKYTYKQAVSDFQLRDYHRKALTDAKRLFQLNSTFGSDDIKIKYLKQTEEVCNDYFIELQMQNQRLLREQSRKISMLRDDCFLNYQSEMDKVLKREKAMSQHELHAFHNKHRTYAVYSFKRDATLTPDRIKICAEELENRIENKYQEFKRANQRRLDIDEKDRVLAEMLRKERQRRTEEELARNARELRDLAEHLSLWLDMMDRLRLLRLLGIVPRFHSNE